MVAPLRVWECRLGLWAPDWQWDPLLADAAAEVVG